MSFTEYDDAFVWRCDGKDCTKEVFFKPHDFMGCVAELRARGWSFHCDDEDRTWTHRCGRCRKPLAELLKMPLKEVGR
jgi:hypothetical protein